MDIKLIVLSLMGIGIFLVFRNFNKEGNPNRGGMGSTLYLIGTCALGIVAYVLSLTLIDGVFPNIRKETEWLPAVISGSAAIIVLGVVSFFDKNSDIYYKNFKRSK